MVVGLVVVLSFLEVAPTIVISASPSFLVASPTPPVITSPTTPIIATGRMHHQGGVAHGVEEIIGSHLFGLIDIFENGHVFFLVCRLLFLLGLLALQSAFFKVKVARELLLHLLVGICSRLFPDLNVLSTLSVAALRLFSDYRLLNWFFLLIFYRLYLLLHLLRRHDGVIHAGQSDLGRLYVRCLWRRSSHDFEVLDVVNFEYHCWLNGIMGGDFSLVGAASAFTPKAPHLFQVHRALLAVDRDEAAFVAYLGVGDQRDNRPGDLVSLHGLLRSLLLFCAC